MTAHDLINMLERRHAKDVILTEIAIDGGKRRMDAWAMIPSWSGGLSIGYEVKVSRSDFINDQKMQDYLPYCQQAYLVTPSPEIARIDELPEGYGLIVASGSRLLTKAKAPVRDVSIPEAFYQALISRRVRNDYSRMLPAEIEIARRVERFAELKDYADGRKELKDIGRSVSARIYVDLCNIEREKQRLDNREDELKYRMGNWKIVCDRVKSEFGINIDSITSYSSEMAYRHVKSIIEGPHYPLFEKIDEMHREMLRLKEKLG